MTKGGIFLLAACIGISLLLGVVTDFIFLVLLYWGHSGFPLKCVLEPQEKQILPLKLNFLFSVFSLSTEELLVTGSADASAGHYFSVNKSLYSSWINPHKPMGPRVG